jgi:hypothetical protein
MLGLIALALEVWENVNIVWLLDHLEAAPGAVGAADPIPAGDRFIIWLSAGPRRDNVPSVRKAPGVKITHKAFGRDRRYPITNAFRKLGLSGP